jgi:hypothetical protein
MKRLLTLSTEKKIFLLVFLASLFVVFTPANSLVNWYASDDAFYYFKTAQNFSEGYGLSFDRIGRSSGFHPLWMLVCIPVFALARFDLILPLRILVLISILLNAGSAVLVYRILKDRLTPFIAVFFSLFWALSRQIFGTTTMQGMESGISAFFVLMLLYLTIQRLQSVSGNTPKLWQIGIVATLAIFSRLDNIFLAGFMGIWLLFKPATLRYLISMDILAAVISVFCSTFLRLGYGVIYAQYLDATQIMAVAAPILHLIVFYFAGLYGHNRRESLWATLIRIAASVGVSSVLLAGVMLTLQITGVIAGFPRAVLIFDAAFVLLFTLVIRFGFLFVSNSPAPLPTADPLASLSLQWKTWLRDGIAYAAPIALSLATYMSFNRVYFGVWTPVSGQIKHWWGNLITVYGRPIDSIPAFFGYSPDLQSGPWGLFSWLSKSLVYDIEFWFKLENELLYNNLIKVLSLIGLAAAILLIIFLRKKIKPLFHSLALMPLLTGCLIQIMQYNGTRYVNTRGWYWITEFIFLMLFNAIIFDSLYQVVIQHVGKPRLLKVFQVGIIGVLLVNFVIYLEHQVPLVVSPEKRYAFQDSFRELEAATQPGDVIGSSGGGIIAYFIQDRTIVNLDGLMNSVEYFTGLRVFKTEEYYKKINMKYVYANEYVIISGEPYIIIFEDHLEKLGKVGGSMLFRYLP